MFLLESKRPSFAPIQHYLLVCSLCLYTVSSWRCEIDFCVKAQ
jgi:hypothetical protein